MKRILAVIIFILMATTNSFAVIFIDGFGANVDAGDLENQFGYGAGFGFDINQNLNFLFRAANTSTTENRNELDEISYDHTTYLAGIEFVPVIPALQQYRLSWRTSLLAGVSDSGAEPENNKGVQEMGFSCAFWTGLQFDLTQVISPFIDLGYHSSFYRDELKNESINGYQVALGIRFYITGNRDYTGDYH